MSYLFQAYYPNKLSMKNPILQLKINKYNKQRQFIEKLIN
jgi:hypothetical protein